MRNPQFERINNRIDHLIDDLLVLKGLERSGADVSATIQSVSEELKTLESHKRNLPWAGDSDGSGERSRHSAG